MPTYFFRSVVGVFFALTAALCSAEILHGIRPLDTLKEIKGKFPNAQFRRVPAAWVTADQAFFQMDGQGFVGTLYLAFSDERPEAKKYVGRECLSSSDDEEKFLCKMYKSIAAASDDDALTINWVRWVPPASIPFERYRSKYGEPTKIEFDNDTMIPFAYWEKVELRATLSDDKKSVRHVTSTFTLEEMRQSWQRRNGFIPDFLKERPNLSPKPEPKSPASQRPRSQM